MKWFISFFVFLLPLFIVRFPIFVAGAGAQIPFLEIAAYGIAAIVFLRDTKGSTDVVKSFFFENKLLLIGLVLLWAGLLIGIFQSNSVTVSVGIVRGWFFAPFVWFLVLVVLKNKEHLGPLLALAFASSAGVVSIIALLLPHFNQDARITGFYSSPNYLAMYIAPLIPFVAYQAYLSFGKNFAPHTIIESLKKYIWIFVLGACLIAVLFSFSFGSWLGLATAFSAVVLYLAFRWYKKFFWLLVSFGAFAAVVGVVLLRHRVLEKIHSRLGLWQAAWNMGTSHPPFGIGEGMFQTAYQIQKHLIPYPVPLDSALHPHNIFLTFWLYAGLPGLIGFFCILVWIGQRIFAKLKQAPGNFLIVAVACSFIIILAHGLVDTTYWKNDLAFMWWTLVALLV